MSEQNTMIEPRLLTAGEVEQLLDHSTGPVACERDMANLRYTIADKDAEIAWLRDALTTP